MASNFDKTPTKSRKKVMQNTQDTPTKVVQNDVNDSLKGLVCMICRIDFKVSGRLPCCFTRTLQNKGCVPEDLVMKHLGLSFDSINYEKCKVCRQCIHWLKALETHLKKRHDEDEKKERFRKN